MPKATISSSRTEHGLQNGALHLNGHHIPNHIAIIMDGNGRWAQSHGLPRLEGHKAGTKNVRGVLEALEKFGVHYVTLFAFSTENWSRPAEEVQGLMKILRETIKGETQTLLEKNVRLRYLGRMDRLSTEFRDEIYKVLELTRNNTGVNLCVALDYGGRDEIVHAVREIVRQGIPPEQIDGRLIEEHLYTKDLPDPDLIIRTAGEQRLSNFLVWQSVYSEYYCSPVFWPDFDEEEMARAIYAFSQRKRRFGALAHEK